MTALPALGDYGAEIFDTCVWIGRYQQTLIDHCIPVELIPRLKVRLHHCHTGKAGDANASLIIARNRLAERRAAYEKTQAEVDRLEKLAPLLEQIRDAEKGDDEGPAVVEVNE